MDTPLPDDPDRRRFLGRVGLGTLSALLGTVVPFGRGFPDGLLPAAFAAPANGLLGKDPGLVVLNDRPLNAEVPAHLLADAVTPASRMFVRNNGVPPAAVDPATWTLTIGGEAVKAERTFTLAELKRDFAHHTYELVLECGGNGRAEFVPGAKGNQWTTGAVSCARWTGVRLADVLEAVGVTPEAVYVGYYGRDTHLSGDPKKVVISRGIPIAKARQPETLLAFQMNGEDIPLAHGAPLRLVAGGWPASTSGKWIDRLVVRDRVHDGPKMEGQSYRMPCKPVAPGAEVPDAEMCIIESMPVKSLITLPRSGLVHPDPQAPLAVAGHAWAGERAVAALHLSIDFGQTWQAVPVQAP
ncbi:MAG: sulfite oxidase, partial [Myxococcales bacterium]|nr:sulfite oxidase [Myxococcales bacterium]